MIILVLEFFFTGHRAAYLRHAVKAYVDGGNHVILAVPYKCVANQICTELTKDYQQSVSISTIDEDVEEIQHLNQVSREFRYRKIMAKTYKRVSASANIEYVFIPYLDYCLYAVGLSGSPFGETKWGGICMRPSFHYQYFEVKAPKPKFSMVKELIFKRLLRKNEKMFLFSIDQLLVDFCSRMSNSGSTLPLLLNEPAELIGNHTYDSSREAIGIDEKVKVILIYGVIDERKNVKALVDALINHSELSSYNLIIAGKQTPQMESYFLSPKPLQLLKQGRCMLFNQFIDEKFEQLLFSAADFVWVGYSAHYTMSGVLILAKIAGVEVISTDEGLIGWLTRKQHLGYAIDLKDSRKLYCLLQEINLSLKKDALSKEQIKDFSKDHSWSDFEKKLAIVLESK